jgi:hypothetical protein
MKHLSDFESMVSSELDEDIKQNGYGAQITDLLLLQCLRILKAILERRNDR